MADTKISALSPAVSLAPIDIFPIVQGGINRYATIGQVSNLTNTLTVTTTIGTAVPVTSDVALISGDVTLDSSTVVGKKISLISTASGTLTVSLQLLPTTFTFAGPGSTISLIWANSSWNVTTVYGMV